MSAADLFWQSKKKNAEFIFIEWSLFVPATWSQVFSLSESFGTSIRDFNILTHKQLYCTVDHKSHDPCFRVFLMEAGVMTFVARCTFEGQPIYYHFYFSSALLHEINKRSTVMSISDGPAKV